MIYNLELYKDFSGIRPKIKFGMRYSLPSRDIIADSIETVVQAMSYDGLITVVGCDKNMPGALMAMLRLNRPSILVYGGTIDPGCYKDKELDVVSAFEAWGEKVAGQIDEAEFKNVIKNACPGPGACGGMYTANTMASAIEALGMSLPYNSSNPATSQNKIDECKEIGDSIKSLIENDIKPLDIVTLKSLENALRLVTVLGGSTNAVLHFLAIAKAANIDVSIDYFQKTIEENLSDVKSLDFSNDVISPLSKPIKETGHIQILKGNLAKEGSVAKITGKEGLVFSGPAKVFNSEFETIDAIQNSKVNKGEVVVIRYEGPKGGPGMPEMLKPTSAVIGAGLGKDVALITDGRFSGGSHGFVVGHISPESFDGGPIAIIKNGDIIKIDSINNKIELKINNLEFDKRIKNLKLPTNKYHKGVVKKYINTVSSASKGCVTD